MSKPIDHDVTAEVVCPYCGYEFEDSWEFEDDGEFDCYGCDKTFLHSRHVSITYSTEKKESDR